MSAANGKRYWWAKLFFNFFDRLEIKQLRANAAVNGDLICIVCLRIQLACLRTEGIITYKGIGATVEEEIALIINERQDIVEKALRWLVSMGWATRLQNGYEVNYLEYGSESASAERQRRRRERLKLESGVADIHKTLQCNGTSRDIVTTEDIAEEISDEISEQQQQQQHSDTDDVVVAMSDDEQTLLATLTAVNPWNMIDGTAIKLIRKYGVARVRAFEHKLRPQARRGEVGAGLLIKLIGDPNEPTPIASSVANSQNSQKEQKIERFFDTDGVERIRIVE